jgi:hypothetical protein
METKLKTLSMNLSADKSQSKDWDFEVVQEELKTSRNINSGIHAVCRVDSGEVIGQYKGVKVLPYPKIIDTFDVGLTSLGLDVNRTIMTTGNGARMFARYDIATIDARGEKFKSILRVQSSHDGSLSPGFMTEAERLACLNGMVIMGEVFSIFRKHSTEFDLSFLGESIQGAIDTGQAATVKLIDNLSAVQIDTPRVHNLLSNLVDRSHGTGVSERTAMFVNHNWLHPTPDETPLGDNLYRLYNAATRYTRDVNNKGRFEMSRKANIYLSQAFDFMLTKNQLSAMLGTPQNPLDFAGTVISN